MGIEADEDQPRKHFDDEALTELANSIRKNGLLNPISVREKEDGGYTIIAGERRYRAVRMLEWEEIDAIVFDVEGSAAKELQLLENINRKDLNPIELAQAYQGFVDKGYSVQEIGNIVGKPANIISWQMNLLKTRQDIQHLLAKGQLSVAVGIALSKLNFNNQAKALRVMTSTKLSVMEMQLLCKQIYMEETQTQAFAEEQLTKKEYDARSKFEKALERACDGLNDLFKMEQDNPGLLRTALADKIDITEEKLIGLEKSIDRIRRCLSTQRVAMLCR